MILTQAQVRNGEGDIGDEEKQTTCSLPAVYEGQTFSNIFASLHVGQNPHEHVCTCYEQSIVLTG